MHYSFLKSFKKLFFIVPYTAVHVSGTLVPIIRSLLLLLQPEAVNAVRVEGS
jgi:hypothetical protein